MERYDDTDSTWLTAELVGEEAESVVRPPEEVGGVLQVGGLRNLPTETLDDPMEPSNPLPIKKKMGRPFGPILWTPEYIKAVVHDMEVYTESMDFPTESEYCYTRDIAYQRINEIPELRAAKEMMFAKRQAMIIRRGLTLGMGDGPLGSFLLRLAANAGPFSLTEKQALEHAGTIGVQIVDDIS
jgi:hypothetical protein